MKPEILPKPGTGDPSTTGVRATELRTEAHGDGAVLASADTMSGRVPPPAAEDWAVDNEPETELPVPAGELLGGKYSVDAMFAEGGMGIVCAGRHVQLDQPVAIKFLRRALSGRPAIVQRFLNEARALAALRSEYVVRVMDVGQLDSGRPYLVMEHLDGVHLDALLEREGSLSVETVLRYASQVCEALSEAHALGIVHRDIKPENLFLWSGGPAKDAVKVLDFGLAKRLGSAALGVTGPQDSVGSPGYMSPEQITTPHLVDSRTDIWSLGVVLYRLLSGALPFDGASLVEVLSHILNAAAKPLSELRPDIDPELDAIVARCIQKAPAERYETMSQLAAALKAYQDQRQQAASVSEPPVAGASVAPPSSGKLRIAGVRSRWPAACVALAVLASAAIYAGERSGTIRLRNLSDGWLTAPRLDAGADALAPDLQPQPLAFFRLGSAAEPMLGADGRPTSYAVAEPEAAAKPTSLTAPGPAVLTQAQRASRKRAYRDYLKGEGLTSLSERETEPEPAPSAAEPPTEPEPPSAEPPPAEPPPSE